MVRCPLCGRQLTEKDRQMGRCAACGQAMPGWARLAGPPGNQKHAWATGPWALWIAGLALVVPAAILVMDRLLQQQWAPEPPPPEQIRPWVGVGLLAVILALLGAAGGLIAACRAKAWRLAAWSGLALLANGLLLSAWLAGKLSIGL